MTQIQQGNIRIVVIDYRVNTVLYGSGLVVVGLFFGSIRTHIGFPLIGGAIALFGVLFALRTPVTRTVFDRRQATLDVRTFGAFARAHHRGPLREVTGVVVAQQASPVEGEQQEYQMQVKLAGAKQIALSHIWSFNRQRLDYMAAQLTAALDAWKA